MECATFLCCLIRSQCPLQQNKDFNFEEVTRSILFASQCPLQQNKDFNRRDGTQTARRPSRNAPSNRTRISTP